MEWPVLPEYEPDERVWNTIESRLDYQRELPEYEPAEFLWERIEPALPGKTRRMGWQITSLAAGILLILGVSLWYQPQETPIAVQSETAQWIDSKNTSLDQQQNRLETLCEVQQVTCQQPEIQMIRTELTELKQASERLHEQTGLYHNDPQVVAWETQLDEKRAELLKRLAELI